MYIVFVISFIVPFMLSSEIVNYAYGLWIIGVYIEIMFFSLGVLQNMLKDEIRKAI